MLTTRAVMMRSALVGFGLVLAGCMGDSSPTAPATRSQSSSSSSPGGPGPSETGGNDTTDPAPHHGWRNGTFTMVNGPTGHVGGNGNCAVYEAGDVVKIHAGFVTVNWTTTDPVPQAMELAVNGKVARRVTGTSPLRLDLAGHEPHDEPGLWIMLQTKIPGATESTTMAMEWEFTNYDGKSPLEFTPTGCGLGN